MTCNAAKSPRAGHLLTGTKQVAFILFFVWRSISMFICRSKFRLCKPLLEYKCKYNILLVPQQGHLQLWKVTHTVCIFCLWSGMEGDFCYFGGEVWDQTRETTSPNTTHSTIVTGPGEKKTKIHNKASTITQMISENYIKTHILFYV